MTRHYCRGVFCEQKERKTPIKIRVFWDIMPRLLVRSNCPRNKLFSNWHGAASQRTRIFCNIAVRASNPTRLWKHGSLSLVFDRQEKRLGEAGETVWVKRAQTMYKFRKKSSRVPKGILKSTIRSYCRPWIIINAHYSYINKAVPLQAWTGPEGSRNLRLPDFVTTTQDGGKVVNLTRRPPLPPGNTPGTHFC